MSILWAIGGFFLVLTPIVLIHELGHFWAARLSNIRVEEFGFGLPPRAMKLAERNGTIFSLNWIPLGGFVRPAGEDDPGILDGLAAASKRARFFVLSAGAGANLIMAVAGFWIASMIGSPAWAISSVDPDSPAMASGLRTGDVILEIDGAKADSSDSIRASMDRKSGQPVEMLIARGDSQINVVVVPRYPGEFDAQNEGPIGVSLTLSAGGERITRGPIEASVNAFQSIWEYMTLFGRVPLMLIRGEITADQARPISVVGISQIAGQAAEATAISRNLFPLLDIFAIINLALGLTNLLPIPALDGGRIMFVLVEAVRGRRIEPEREGLVHIVGMLVLLGLMVLMIVQDIVNPIIPY